MPRISLLFASVVLALGVAACGGSDDDDGGVTPASPATLTAAPRAATPVVTVTGEDITSTAVAVTAAPPTAEPTQPAVETMPAQEPTVAAQPTTLTIAAANTAFSTASLSAPAGPITIRFVNQDNGVAHNFAVSPAGGGAVLGATAITPGPIESTLGLTLEAGAYTYNCQVHPDMQGTLTVQ